MSQVPAGWFDDPYGRFQQRYWDGARWTEHVATEGRAMVDPMGAVAVVPFATPSSAFDPEAAQSASVAEAGTAGDDASTRPGAIALLDRLGEPARERTRPSLRAAVSGLGGAVLAIGVIALVAGYSAGRGRIIAGAVGVMIAAFGVTFEFPVLLVFLQLVGILTPQILLKQWRIATVVIFGLAAIITPSGDPYSMLALAIPMVIFYGISIVIGRIAQKRKLAREAAEDAA